MQGKELDQDKNSRLILVLGMHRGGTSALTGTLHQLGVSLGGGNTDRADQFNPRGYWEHCEVTALHETILSTLESCWTAIKPLPDNWWRMNVMQPHRKKLLEILEQNFVGTGLCAVKDPRLCRLLPLWIDCLDELGLERCFIQVLRNPDEVAASLGHRDLLYDGTSYLLWLDHMLRAESGTRGQTRTFVDYKKLLSSPVTTVREIANDLNLQWPIGDDDIENQLRSFLDPSLRHHSDAVVKSHLEIANTAAQVYVKLTQNASELDIGFLDHLSARATLGSPSIQPILDALEARRWQDKEKIVELGKVQEEISTGFQQTYDMLLDQIEKNKTLARELHDKELENRSLRETQRIVHQFKTGAEDDTAPDTSAEFGYEITEFWRDSLGVYIKGWVGGHQCRPERLLVERGVGTPYEVRQQAVDETVNTSPFSKERCFSFIEYISVSPVDSIILLVQLGGNKLRIKPMPKQTKPSTDYGENVFDQFASAVNERGGRVVQVGARVVSDTSVDYRPFFPGENRFIGLDIHDGPGVDLVGDAHMLSSLVGCDCLDGVFSLSVLEHLMHPWRHAREINRSLKRGGLVFVSAPQSWPIHELPNDFWRFSDGGLKLLFGESHGFQVITAGMQGEVYLYPGNRSEPYWDFPLAPAYGEAYILARKVREISDEENEYQTQDVSTEYPNVAEHKFLKHPKH